ncbi:hypothetical protein A3770_14p72110 [Chloropicon primus]|uniref:F-box domain-containing protein n=1 Tax=Chloropicon primus TaxID=1764295 RepID=A0A5B8MVW2_9CHLO|nr:hypothetical protein A3770_14p72110 [Chloropicon primus]|eukprot:QDZ24693.1 hypothetical protein A3770_14p72110 [Chloropicon primus]
MAVTGEASERPRAEGRDALDVLPEALWLIIEKHVRPYDRIAFALTCRTFLESAWTTAASLNEKEEKPLPLRTDLTDGKVFEQMPCFSMGWFQ